MLFFFNDTATTEIYTLSLHDALPIYVGRGADRDPGQLGGEDRLRSPFVVGIGVGVQEADRSEEHTSELQSRQYLVCRLLLEKKKKKNLVGRVIPHQRDVQKTTQTIGL